MNDMPVSSWYNRHGGHWSWLLFDLLIGAVAITTALYGLALAGSSFFLGWYHGPTIFLSGLVVIVVSTLLGVMVLGEKEPWDVTKTGGSAVGVDVDRRLP